jgi:hypothetical protein
MREIHARLLLSIVLIILLAVLLLTGCAETCEVCITRCKPYAVSMCRPGEGIIGTSCECDVKVCTEECPPSRKP